MPLREGRQSKLDKSRKHAAMQKNAVIFQKQQEALQKKVTDPLFIETTKSDFMQFEEKKMPILNEAFDTNYAYNPDLLNDLVRMDPEAAMSFVKGKKIELHHTVALRKVEDILRTIFKIKPEEINQNNFDFICAMSGNKLERIEAEPRLLEELCFDHPELAGKNEYVGHINFSEELKEKVEKQRSFIKKRITFNMFQEGVDNLFPKDNGNNQKPSGSTFGLKP